MMKPAFVAVSLTAVLLASGTASATNLALTADLGTTGVGLHMSLPLQKNLNARLGFNTLNYSYSSSTSNVNYDSKLKLNTVDALVDYFPSAGSFRLTGGLTYNSSKITAVGRSNASGTFNFNGNTYTSTDAGQINGKIDFRKIAPYLGIGWGNALQKETGWGFSADAGVLFQGSPSTSLTSSGCTAPSSLCNQLSNDLDVENNRLRDKANDLKLYPVLRVGASYRF
ncbi:hypothetical protein [Actimicrobium sp. CCI2.3]|uniref:hypothetical protein n=1 Tax=Actimicrobium sp. CCI2.3 TaxID=3048616 RepID=UPI002AB4FF89|nr:hypothetical protein [Actimicrobium sp. CCI2.3]MDY7573197.1 hypothetical protein [Actimicrobium sp. CCI2.3]MEB0022176.1 hypothetical protein [Actimicrobium sp. CCI2.3]